MNCGVRKRTVLKILLLVCCSCIDLNAKIIRISPRLIDHGNIRMGTVLEDTLLFKNTGPETVFIEQVTSTCGCTAASPSRRIIAPGDTAAIPYFFETRGYSGLVRKDITVVLRDRPQLLFTFQVNVFEELDISPHYFYLPLLDFSPDTVIVRTFKVLNFSKKIISVKNIQLFTDELKVYPSEAALKPGREYTFKIHYRPAVKVSRHWTILLHTDYQPLPELKIFYYVTFRE